MVVFDVNEVRHQAELQQWHCFRYEKWDGQKVFLERSLQGERYEMHVWCTTGTIATFLDHPRQGKTQLFRRNLDMAGLRKVLNNPRAHTGDGYHERQQIQSQTPRRNVPCPGCNKMCASMSGAAGHFESGACPMCPGQDKARSVAYGNVVKMQHAAGHDGLFTGGMKLLTDETMVLNARGEIDYAAGYQQGGMSYSCPNCQKGFGTSQGLISHCENRQQCRGFLHLVYGM